MVALRLDHSTAKAADSPEGGSIFNRRQGVSFGPAATGAVVAAGFTVWLGFLTRRVVLEATHTRIDDSAPRVAVVNYQLWEEAHPPLSSLGAERVTFDPTNEVPEDMPVMVTVLLRLRNEGRSSAFVTFETKEEWGEVGFGTAPNIIELWQSGKTRCIEPGEALDFLLQVTRRASRWGQNWTQRDDCEDPARLMLQVADQFEMGVADTVEINVLAYPVDNESKTKGTWRVRSIQDYERTRDGFVPFSRVYVRPTKREYRLQEFESYGQENYWLIRRLRGSGNNSQASEENQEDEVVPDLVDNQKWRFPPPSQPARGRDGATSIERTVVENVQRILIGRKSGERRIVPPEQVDVELGDLAGKVKQDLLAFAVGVGLGVFKTLLVEGRTVMAGEKGKNDPAGRISNRHGGQPSWVILGGRKVATSRPRFARLQSYRQ